MVTTKIDYIYIYIDIVKKKWKPNTFKYIENAFRY